jgi:hypothetical protein
MLSDSLGLKAKESDLEAYLSDLSPDRYKQTLQTLSIPDSKKYVSGWNLFKHKVPMWIFILTCLTLAVLAFLRNLSLIPILGVISCLYMMAQIELKNWIGFTIWLLIGLVIYFSYGRKNSRLATK